MGREPVQVLDLLSELLHVGSESWDDRVAHGVIDELRISDVPRVGDSDTCGRILVADSGNDRIVRLSTKLNGSGWKTYGTDGSGTGQFKEPAGIAVSAGYIYVADTYNNRIVRLATALNGSGWKAYGSQGSGAGKFARPNALAIRGSYIYVADTDNERVVKLKAPSLSWVTTAGSLGSGNAKFNQPVGIEVRGGYLYIGDTGWWPGGNHRVVKWTTGE